MSITFTALSTLGTALLAGEREPETACLCAQAAATWDMYLEGSDRAELAACAQPACPICGGTGVEPGSAPVLSLNLSNWNATALLRLLGLEGACGAITLPEARRAIMRARATFERRADALTVEAAEVVLPTRVEREGNVARIVRGAILSIGGLDREGLAERLERFAAFVERAATLGAARIGWS